MINNPSYGAQGYGVGGYGNEPLEALPIGYYQNLLTAQYRNSPKLTQLLKVLLQKFDDISQCLTQLDTAFDLDSAIGVQLDMLGVTAQADRTLPFQPSFGVSPVMDDDTYRIYIKAKIAQNQWNGTLGSLYTMWYGDPVTGQPGLFPTVKLIVEDGQNMTATLHIGGLPSTLLIDMIAGYAVNGALSGTVHNSMLVPRPEGVEYTFSLVTLPIFGFGAVNTPYVAAWGVGSWS